MQNLLQKTNISKIYFTLLIAAAILTPQFAVLGGTSSRAVVSLWDILIAIGCLFILFQLITGRFTVRDALHSPLVAIVALFIVVALVSVLNTYIVWGSNTLVFYSLLNWLRLVEIFVPFFIALMVKFEKNDVYYYLLVLLIVGLISSLIGFTYLGNIQNDTVFSKKLFRGNFQTIKFQGDLYRRNPGSFGDANYFGLFMAMVLFAVFALRSLVTENKKYITYISYVAVAVVFISLLLTASKSTFIILMAGLAAYVVLKKTRAAKYAFELLIYFLFFVFILPTPSWFTYQMTKPIVFLEQVSENLAQVTGGDSTDTITIEDDLEEIEEEVTIPGDEDLQESFNDFTRASLQGATGTKRLDMWEVAQKTMTVSPLFGIGYEVAKYVTPYTGFHNLYLTLLVEVGVIGFGIFTALIFYTGLLLVQSLRKNPGSKEARVLKRLLLVWLALSVLQSLVHGSFFYWRTASLFWLFMGILVSLFHVENMFTHKDD